MGQKVAEIKINQLIHFLTKELDNLPDRRKPGNNTKYEISDALLSAFSIFFTQSPSFLSHQRLMEKIKEKNNASSLFKISKIPCDNQIRNLLDPLSAQTIYPVYQKIYQWLKKKKVLKKFFYLEGEILIALDGTEYFSSKKINCPHCNCRNHRNGTTTYFHGCVIPAIVSPNMKQVISLEPEFIKKQDGYKKQDCENAAVKRWLNKNQQKQYDNPVTLLGDDLYSRQPIGELALEKDYNFIFVCRETSHKTLYEWLEFLDKSGEVKTLEKKEWNGRKELIYRYRYTNKIPLKDGENSLQVNWCKLTVINQKTQEITYQNSWITNHQINGKNVPQIVKAGRSRWKIENESNNVLKNHGYNLEHNFGHGQNNLCEMLLSLNLLAFLFHSVLDLANSTYKKVRDLLVSRRSFFNDIRTLLKYFWFATWQDLLNFILTDNVPDSTSNSS
ncbi:MAG: ISNCY family transposase [Xenococcus sp. (in: cyanobacteria)]